MNYHIPSAADMQDIHNQYKEEQFHMLVCELNAALKKDGKACTNQYKERITTTYARLGYKVQEFIDDNNNKYIEIKLPIFPSNL